MSTDFDVAALSALTSMEELGDYARGHKTHGHALDIVDLRALLDEHTKRVVAALMPTSVRASTTEAMTTSLITTHWIIEPVMLTCNSHPWENRWILLARRNDIVDDNRYAWPVDETQGVVKPLCRQPTKVEAQSFAKHLDAVLELKKQNNRPTYSHGDGSTGTP